MGLVDHLVCHNGWVREFGPGCETKDDVSVAKTTLGSQMPLTDPRLRVILTPFLIQRLPRKSRDLRKRTPRPAAECTGSRLGTRPLKQDELSLTA